MSNKASKKDAIAIIKSALAAGWARKVEKVGHWSVCVDLSFTPSKSWEPLRSVQIFFRRPIAKRGHSSVSINSWATYPCPGIHAPNKGAFHAWFEIRASKGE